MRHPTLAEADQHHLAGRFLQAVKVYRQLVVREPASFEVWGGPGHAAASMQEYGEAIPALRRALTIRPDRHGLRVNLGKVAFAIGHVAQDTREFVRARDEGDEPARAMALRDLAVEAPGSAVPRTGSDRLQRLRAHGLKRALERPMPGLAVTSPAASRLAGLAACLLALQCVAALAAPSPRVEPGPRVLDGQPVHLSIEGAPPRTALTLTAERWFAPLSTSPRPPRLMRARAVFVADDEGRVDVRTAVAVGGTYTGADPRGLFWSMQPVPDIDRSPPGDVDSSEVRFELEVAGVRTQAQVSLLPALPGVRVAPAAGLPGAVLAIPPGAGPWPVVILLGGSEGGSLITRAAAPLASHGLAVLALPVFSPPDRAGVREIPALPAAWADLPVESLDRAREWLSRRPELDATRIALHGTSMGALLALLGAVHLPWVTAVVANVPSDVVWDGWGPGVEGGQRSTFSVAGRPLPFVPLVGYEEELKGYERNEPVVLKRAFERGRAARPDLAAKARVPVERIRVPLLVIGAHDDQMWPSGPMTQNIAERRAEAGLLTEVLLFQDAGHLLFDTGYAPTTGYNAGLRKTGGTPQANARAQAEVHSRTVRFLKRALKAGGD